MLVVSMSSLVCTFCLTFLCHGLLVYKSRETVLFTVSMSFLLYTSCPTFLCHHLLQISGHYFVPCFDVISRIHILPCISVTISFLFFFYKYRETILFPGSMSSIVYTFYLTFICDHLLVYKFCSLFQYHFS